jgi:hypothetical protein
MQNMDNNMQINIQNMHIPSFHMQNMQHNRQNIQINMQNMQNNMQNNMQYIYAHTIFLIQNMKNSMQNTKTIWNKYADYHDAKIYMKPISGIKNTDMCVFCIFARNMHSPLC